MPTSKKNVFTSNEQMNKKVKILTHKESEQITRMIKQLHKSKIPTNRNTWYVFASNRQMHKTENINA